jgi:predicted transcriptional regulator of viral defense system
VTSGYALAHHGLSDQSFRTIIVLSPVQQRGWHWQGERVVYVLQPEERIWGGRPLKPADSPTFVAGGDRAIVDSLAHPRWGVTLGQVVEAIRKASSDPGFSERLARTAARYGNAAVARRLGFITSRLGGERAALPFRSLIGTSRAPALLDVSGPHSGKPHPEWRLTENVAFDLLAEAANA